MKVSIFQSVVLAVFGVGALIGLFVFATYSSNGNKEADLIGPVTVWGTLPDTGINAALMQIVQSNEALKGVSYVQKDPATFKEELNAAIATGQAPDAVLISQEQLLGLMPVLQPVDPATLTPRTFSTAFAEEGELFQSTEGAYGVPFLIDPLVLYWNRPLISSAGLSGPPTTWEAVTGLVPHVTTLSGSGKITQALIAMGTYANVKNARAILSTLFLQTGVPVTSRASTGILSASLRGNQGSSSAGSAVLRFYSQFSDPAKVSYTWDSNQPASDQAFIAGDLALYLGFASEAAYLRAANPNLNFDVAPVPQPATASAKGTYGLVYAIAIPRGSANPAGAYEAAAALSNTTEQQILAMATGLAPATRAALATEPQNPILAIAFKSALYARGWLSPAPSDTDRIFGAMISNVISGRLTLDAALSSAEASLNNLLP